MGLPTFFFKMRTDLLISFLYLLLSSVYANATDYLFRNGNTPYQIVISPNASVTEKTAAKDLKSYLEQISGVDFKLSNTPGSRNIYVGYENDYEVFKGIEPYNSDFDGFSVKKIGHDLVIYGGSERGTMYGVYRFLQEFLGVRWYTPDFTKVPSSRKYILTNFDFSEEPRIKYRYTDFYCAQNIPWLAHNTMNTRRSKKQNVYGVDKRYWGAHSLATLLPSDKYFNTHPEYYAYRNLRRIKSGQPCLSNPDVLKIVTNEILSVIDRSPSYLVYDVSQRDNQNFCTCKKCIALEEKYGGHSGILIWFVNQVAREVKKKYPDKYIGTLAYHYTRNAPTNIKPDDNVVIRLCDIECCLVHPLSDKCNEHNAAFMKDLDEWSKLTKNIYIWDYIVNYGNYMAPFPNFQVLGPNLKTFAEHGAIEVYEEAQGGTMGNAFEELKCWVLAQLMWNPDLNTNELVSQFINDYYGEAGKYIQKYYNLCQSLITEDTHMRCYFDPTMPPFTDQFIVEAYDVLNKALENTNNEIIKERVRKVMLQPMALECARQPRIFYESGKWPVFKSQMLKYKSYYKIHVSPQEFIESFESKMK